MIFHAQISKEGSLSVEIPQFLWGKNITISETIEITDEFKEFELSEADTWDLLDIEAMSADMGRSDGSVNHDYYIYGIPKI